MPITKIIRGAKRGAAALRRSFSRKNTITIHCGHGKKVEIPKAELKNQPAILKAITKLNRAVKKGRITHFTTSPKHVGVVHDRARPEELNAANIVKHFLDKRAQKP